MQVTTEVLAIVQRNLLLKRVADLRDRLRHAPQRRMPEVARELQLAQRELDAHREALGELSC